MLALLFIVPTIAYFWFRLAPLSLYFPFLSVPYNIQVVTSFRDRNGDTYLSSQDVWVLFSLVVAYALDDVFDPPHLYLTIFRCLVGEALAKTLNQTGL